MRRHAAGRVLPFVSDASSLTMIRKLKTNFTLAKSPLKQIRLLPYDDHLLIKVNDFPDFVEYDRRTATFPLPMTV